MGTEKGPFRHLLTLYSFFYMFDHFFRFSGSVLEYSTKLLGDPKILLPSSTVGYKSPVIRHPPSTPPPHKFDKTLLGPQTPTWKKSGEKVCQIFCNGKSLLFPFITDNDDDEDDDGEQQGGGEVEASRGMSDYPPPPKLCLNPSSLHTHWLFPIHHMSTTIFSGIFILPSNWILYFGGNVSITCQQHHQ